jgi:hypothetical protein
MRCAEGLTFRTTRLQASGLSYQPLSQNNKPRAESWVLTSALREDQPFRYPL